MYYLDSNAFIYPALYEGTKADGAAQLLQEIVAGDTEGATASLTLDEVVWITSRETDRETALRQGQRILQFPNLQILDVRERESRGMIEEMETYEELAPRDAIHLAAMKSRDIGDIVSDDRDFDPVEGVTRHELAAFVDE